MEQRGSSESRDLFWAGLAMAVIYSELVFRKLEYCPEFLSGVILGLLVMGCVLLGYMLCRFSGKSMIHHWMIIGLGLYTLLAYRPLYGYPLLMGSILGAAVLLAVLYAVLLCQLKVQTTDSVRRERIRRGRKRRAARAALWIVSAGFSLMMAACTLAQILNYPALQTSAAPAVQKGTEEQTILSNLETLALLQEEEWGELPLQKRLEVLQTVANIEAYDLGLPEPLTVVGVGEALSLGGSYDDENRRILINLSNLKDESAVEALDSLLHEAYHSYQHRLVEVYDKLDEESRRLMVFQNAAQYKVEFENYIDSEENLVDYYVQRCEQDARSYAELACDYYFQKIEEYLVRQTAQEQTGQLASSAIS